jgi:hypothetical protein
LRLQAKDWTGVQLEIPQVTDASGKLLQYNTLVVTLPDLTPYSHPIGAASSTSAPMDAFHLWSKESLAGKSQKAPTASGGANGKAGE